jgi:putative ABC transport system substrate-binding protein
VIFMQLHAAPAAAEKSEVRVVILKSKDAAPYRAVLDGFKQQLSQDGIGAHYELHDIGTNQSLPKIATSPAEDGERLIVLSVDPVSSRIAVRQIRHRPVIAALVVRPEEADASPNATGVLLDYPVEEQLRWIRRLLPDRRNVGVLFNPRENDKRIAVANDTAGELGLSLLAEKIAQPNDLPTALRTIAKRADLVWGISDHTVFTPQTAKQLIVFSFQNRIPLSGLSTSWVKAGALYSLERDYFDIGTQCAELAEAVLDGKSPSELPLLTPRVVLYSVNLKTARHMNISFPEDMVQEAAHAFE